MPSPATSGRRAARAVVYPVPMNLEPALAAERHEFDGPDCRLSYYLSRPSSRDPEEPPLLLLHSVNAAGSAYEMRPLFERHRSHRTVYALDLPGFGFSERSDLRYSPRLMTDAVLAMLDEAASRHRDTRFEVAALSLWCEFAARAATEAPERFVNLALVSPTGLDGTTPRRGSREAHRGIPAMSAILSVPRLNERLFAWLTSRAGVGYFMRKAFGRADVDPELIDYAWRTSHQPGAHFAPLRFVAGYLFSRDAFAVYESLALPVWVAHGRRGDFTDYRLLRRLAGRANWMVDVFDTGALPQFEVPDEFDRRYRRFLDEARGRGG